MAATIVVTLRLPLAAVVIALLLTSGSGVEVTPLIIVATVVASVLADVSDSAVGPRATTAPPQP
jgi:hypothetical protein